MNALLKFIRPKGKKTEVEKYRKVSISSTEEELLIRKIQTVIHSGLYKMNDLDLQKLADSVGSQKYIVSMIINKHFGQNFNQWLTHYRLEEAKKMLLDEPSISIKTIIFESGFNSTSTFYHAFRKYTNLTPNEFKMVYFQY